MARGCSVVAKSVTPRRIEENRKVIRLDDEDMQALNNIAAEMPKRYVYPEFGVNLGFPDRTEGINMI